MSVEVMSPFLYRGISLAVFRIDGNFPSERERFIKCVRGARRRFADFSMRFVLNYLDSLV